MNQESLDSRVPLVHEDILAIQDPLDRQDRLDSKEYLDRRDGLARQVTPVQQVPQVTGVLLEILAVQEVVGLLVRREQLVFADCQERQVQQVLQVKLGR